ncbi:hypothetical protein PCANC_26712 [Puccinia coronata f. sp. avenae]|uniref:Uncharacterized protein n=1 Tax=Puccinia coronata f. sp. avenae TaxID=200324 RepID=A0A2N5S900_9BASI|nr:hypothetical protein PCANC_26712 [Puccinia coronata f. sp. avenae]
MHVELSASAHHTASVPTVVAWPLTELPLPLLVSNKLVRLTNLGACQPPPLPPPSPDQSKPLPSPSFPLLTNPGCPLAPSANKWVRPPACLLSPAPSLLLGEPAPWLTILAIAARTLTDFCNKQVPPRAQPRPATSLLLGPPTCSAPPSNLPSPRSPHVLSPTRLLAQPSSLPSSRCTLSPARLLAQTSALPPRAQPRPLPLACLDRRPPPMCSALPTPACSLRPV